MGFKNENEQAEQWKELALVIAKDLNLSLESLSDSERYKPAPPISRPTQPCFKSGKRFLKLCRWTQPILDLPPQS